MSQLHPSPTVPSRYHRFERLFEARILISQTGDFAEQMNILVSAACEITFSSFAAIFVLEPETGSLKLLATPEKYRAALRLARLPLQGNLAGLCVQRAAALKVDQAAMPPQDGARRKQTGALFELSPAAAAPLIARQQVSGALVVSQKFGNGHYTEEDVSLLESLAFLAAILYDSHTLAAANQRAARRLEDLDRMKTDFIAITSHELRTPLGLIIGHANLLVESLPPGQARREAQVIAKQAARVAQRVEELGHAGPQAGDTGVLSGRPVNITALLDEVLALYAQPAQEKKIQLIRDYPETKVLAVKGDPEKLLLAINNVVKNALSFTDPNGHILVSAERLPGYVRISVVDDGVGIPENDQHRIFERFYQVESHLTRRHEGLGLGLTVAKTMVEMHGGEIWVASQEGQGSNFSILLPDGSGARPKKQPAFIMDPE